MPVSKRTVRTKRIEHFKIADYSFIDVEHEISQEDVEIDSVQEVQLEIDTQVMEYFNKARKEIKKAFNKGEFEL